MTESNHEPMTYAGSGVDYDALDRFKRRAQEAAAETAGNIDRLDLYSAESSRGESVYLIEKGLYYYLAHVEEGLGTKNLVADTYLASGRKWSSEDKRRYYANLAQDTVAMIVNDMITLGAMPLSVAMHLAVGDSAYLEDEARMDGIIEGWQRACHMSNCVWGGGETPVLKGIVDPRTMLLSGSATGMIKPKRRRILCNIQPGDAIVMMASSGIHANGLTLARQILHKVGYDAIMVDGQPFIDALLRPTAIYVEAVKALLDVDSMSAASLGLSVHYAVNITGHGWRKLMRAVDPFVYVIEEVPQPQPVFDFIAEHGPVDQEEMYANYNMGAGFVVYVSSDRVDRAVELLKQRDIQAWVAGHVEKRGEEKKVVIEPLGIEYDGSTLGVR